MIKFFMALTELTLWKMNFWKHFLKEKKKKKATTKAKYFEKIDFSIKKN
jgi:hypothetical protein